jgi:flagellar hook-associated protein 3 FlgL
MRITSANATQSAMAQLQQRQQQINTLQGQLASGRRVERPSDDPAAAARAERALAELQRNAAQQRALEASRTAMQQGEVALGDAGELLQQAREVVMGAGNGIFNASDRASLVMVLQGLRQGLLAVANRQDSSGQPLFGGQGGVVPPLLDGPGGVVFQGTAGPRVADAGEPMPLALDGRRVFLELADPVTPGAVMSMFDLLDRAIRELGDPDADGPAVAESVRTALSGIDAAIDHTSQWRARAGETLKRIDGLETRLALARIDAEQDRSSAQDMDLIEGISRFQKLQSGYDAALRTYSMVQRMTLFDYIR